jgi:hypothetical protein
MLEPAVREKIEDLVRRSSQIALRGERLEGREHIAACHSWITEALNIIDFAVPIENNAYSRAIKQHGGDRIALLNNVSAMGSILSSLLADSDAGLIADFGNKIRAETFDDFLDHADIYREEGQKQPAGVLAGVVFEDTIRRICRNNEIAGENLEQLINALARQEVITGQQSKQAKIAAHVRTKATHALWDEYDLSGVEDTIRLTRALLAKHLGG